MTDLRKSTNRSIVPLAGSQGEREWLCHNCAKEIFDDRASWGAASSAPTCVVMFGDLERAHSQEWLCHWGLLEFGVFGFSCEQDWDFGVGVFPEGEEVLVGYASFGVVALERVGAG